MTDAVDLLADAARAVAGARCWVLSDGKAGDEAQCLGVAERLGLAAEVRRVTPRAPYNWLAPWGQPDPRDLAAIAGRAPDIAIASGRRTAPYLRKIKSLSAGKTFTVFLKDPRSGVKTADFIWVPQHDRLRGANVLTTLTSPHRLSPGRLAAAAANPPHGLAALPRPRVAVILGGNSKRHAFTPADISDVCAKLAALAATGATLMATASRRTPPALAQEAQRIIDGAGGFYWSGAGENPYLALLALADAVVVTADSVNMVGEAAVTGRPVLVFEPTGGDAKSATFLGELARAGVTRPFAGRMETYIYDEIDSTPLIAAELARRYAAFRSGR